MPSQTCSETSTPAFAGTLGIAQAVVQQDLIAANVQLQWRQTVQVGVQRRGAGILCGGLAQIHGGAGIHHGIAQVQLGVVAVAVAVALVAQIGPWRHGDGCYRLYGVIQRVQPR